MSRKVIINSEISDILKRSNIKFEDGVSILILLYYNTIPSFIPQDTLNKILNLGILDMDYSTNTYIWKKPLFEESQTGFEWIKEWMDLFKAVNPDRKGIRVDVMKRMKKFFANNPSVRVDDVFTATKKYLSTLSDPQYCKKSHKFIYEQDNSSLLLDYIEQLKMR